MINPLPPSQLCSKVQTILLTVATCRVSRLSSHLAILRCTARALPHSHISVYNHLACTSFTFSSGLVKSQVGVIGNMRRSRTYTSHIGKCAFVCGCGCRSKHGHSQHHDTHHHRSHYSSYSVLVHFQIPPFKLLSTVSKTRLA